MDASTASQDVVKQEAQLLQETAGQSVAELQDLLKARMVKPKCTCICAIGNC